MNNGGQVRPYMIGPNVPTERVRALRQAFLDTFKDPSFINDAQKLRLELDETPASGEAVQALINDAFRAPKAVINRLSALYNVGKE